MFTNRISSFIRNLILAFNYPEILYGYKDSKGHGWKIFMKQDKGVASVISPVMSADLEKAIKGDSRFWVDNNVILNKGSILSDIHREDLLLEKGDAFYVNLNLGDRKESVEVSKPLYDEIHKTVSRARANLAIREEKL